MWYGEAAGTQGKTCCLLATLDPDPDALEIVCVIGFKDFKGQILENAVRCAFQFDWADESDGGTLLIWMGNGVERWVEVSRPKSKKQLALPLFEKQVLDLRKWEIYMLSLAVWSPHINNPPPLSRLFFGTTKLHLTSPYSNSWGSFN